MRLFLLTFLLVYGSLHAYAFLKAKAAFAFGWGTAMVLLPVLAFLLLAPLLTHLLAARGQESAARGVAFTGYCWMGFLFLLVWLLLASDIARLVLRLGGHAHGKAAGFLSGPAAFLGIAALALILAATSVFEASRIEVVRVRIVTDRLPPSVPRLRIAQISDLHLGLIHRNGIARKVAGIVSRERPDLLVSTGDLVDGELDHIEGLARALQGIPAPMGKFAVVGNHEYYAGLSRAIAFTRNAGFTVLRDSSAVAGGVVRIAGVDDPARGRFGPGSGPGEADVLGNRPDGLFTVLLKHRPVIDPASAGRFDLQLSGHTHNGQIFPFLALTRLAYPLVGGTHPVPGGGTLHVSRGTGTWGPPMRLFAAPEITIFDLEGSP